MWPTRAVSPGPSRIYKEDDADELHELFHRRNMLAVFCKLVVYNVLDLSAAAEIYQFYLKVPARPPCPPPAPAGLPLPRPLLSCARHRVGVTDSKRTESTGGRWPVLRTHGSRGPHHFLRTSPVQHAWGPRPP